jgi:hypothetical protein
LPAYFFVAHLSNTFILIIARNLNTFYVLAFLFINIIWQYVLRTFRKNLNTDVKMTMQKKSTNCLFSTINIIIMNKHQDKYSDCYRPWKSKGAWYSKFAQWA